MNIENLSTLKIHKLSQEQYNTALANNQIDNNALYLTPEDTSFQIGKKFENNAVIIGRFDENNNPNIAIGKSAMAEGSNGQVNILLEFPEQQITLEEINIDYFLLGPQVTYLENKKFIDAICSSPFEIKFNNLSQYIKVNSSIFENGFIKAYISDDDEWKQNFTQIQENPPSSIIDIQKKCGAYGFASHVECLNNVALGGASHAEGHFNATQANCAHAEGHGNLARGYASHAEGRTTETRGHSSHASGRGTFASGAQQFVIGTFNKIDTEKNNGGTLELEADGLPKYQYLDDVDNYLEVKSKYAFIIGNGSNASDEGRSNALTVDWKGNTWIAGGLTASGTTNLNGKLILKSGVHYGTKDQLPAAAQSTEGQIFFVKA